jgi:hypothetical protein
MTFIPAKLFNDSLSCTLLLAFCLALAGISTAQNCAAPAGGWSQSHQPPVGCPVYQNSLFIQQLPNAGSGGPMTHLAPNSDAIIQNQGSGYSSGGTGGNFLPGFTGIDATNGDSTANPFYYGRASDPIYKLDQCANSRPGDPTHSPAGKFWHIPNGARQSNSGHSGDAFLTVWDQTNDTVLSIYNGNRILPNCTASTTAAACSMGSISYCSMANRLTDKGYQAGNGAGDSLNEAPGALIIRSSEWVWPTSVNPDYKGIKHALYLNGSCEGGNPGQSVFPAGSGTASQCGDPAGPKPIHGSLIFMDYTDAQIASMSIPPWQKSIIWTMSHYGGYFGDTNDSAAPGHGNQGMYPTRYEGYEAYTTAGITWPLQNWLAGQPGMAPSPGGNMTFSYWANIPNVVGPNCRTSTCGVASHTHIAAECVALGLAGQPGGCANIEADLPASPTGLTATVQ